MWYYDWTRDQTEMRDFMTGQEIISATAIRFSLWVSRAFYL